MELKVLEYREGARAPFKNSILSNNKLVGWILTAFLQQRGTAEKVPYGDTTS